ncbi:hypothetical protein BRARA_C01441 [Brassica rapa]|uniref:Bifunctional inhibitor/plant lipid transfer protein/seed storage helical domain-containing protein n=4 Tax=Brassica TaxID=3705 RepID=A0ABQ8DSK1_BRANA|nr:stamen-specific protein FIL1 [Brassica rapa]XP_048630024.1 stamen-specific protein FIL1-like [Brassica napus]KAG5403933.1 hypothetical protein IGI04_010052 [Brassica rapa subsp. trilocularis]KAH0932339.1 hypothetical protein HID58_009456 [Brassica napus]RID69342.1 hypothetical protein BRARA_C01441 [Brassica rapa]CAG7880227.1 unnamed protein product [Brassica rapa]VDC79653.1 unnamed protein product [Brassica rapa]
MALSSSSSKSSLAMIMKVAALVALVLVATEVDGQSCNRHLSGLNVCGEFVVPGADKTNPSAECCSALEAVPSECLCNTMRIASRLPTRCSIPTLSCS